MHPTTLDRTDHRDLLDAVRDAGTDTGRGQPSLRRRTPRRGFADAERARSSRAPRPAARR